jgi:hypothetical protein
MPTRIIRAIIGQAFKVFVAFVTLQTLLPPPFEHTTTHKNNRTTTT